MKLVLAMGPDFGRLGGHRRMRRDGNQPGSSQLPEIKIVGRVMRPLATVEVNRLRPQLGFVNPERSSSHQTESASASRSVLKSAAGALYPPSFVSTLAERAQRPAPCRARRCRAWRRAWSASQESQLLEGPSSGAWCCEYDSRLSKGFARSEDVRFGEGSVLRPPCVKRSPETVLIMLTVIALNRIFPIARVERAAHRVQTEHSWCRERCAHHRRARARRTIGDVVTETIAAIVPQRGDAPGATANNSFKLPHSSASTCEKLIQRSRSTGMTARSLRERAGTACAARCERAGAARRRRGIG